MTIRRLRLVAFLGFLLLVAASVAVTFAALQDQREDALIINLAGRQRMLTQRMTLEVLGLQTGASPAYRQALRDTAHLYFEPTLNALVAGGEAPYGDGTTVALPPTRDPEILAQLETVRARWEEMHGAIHVVLESDPQNPAFARAVGEVERLSPVILSQMDQAVRLYEAEAARKVARVEYIQLSFLATAMALLIATLVGTDRWVLGPIDQLGTAARRIGEGDLETPVSAVGLGEVDRLARGFDDMRRNLAAADLSAHLLDSMLDAVIVANPDGTVRMMNRAALELLGYTAAEVAGQPVGRFFEEEEEEEEEEEVTFFRGTGLAQLVREGAAREVGTTLVTRAGERVPVVFNGSVVRGADGGLLAVVGVARDMRERKRQERRLAAEYAVTRIVAEFTMLDDAAPKILQAICECLGWEVGEIWTVDQQANVLRSTQIWHTPSPRLSDFLEATRRITFAPGVGLPGRVWASGAPAWIADVVLDPNFPRAPAAVRSGLHAAFAFPIRLRNETLGVMNFFSSQVQLSDDALLAMMASIGSQIAVAIERARLHERVKAQRIAEREGLYRLALDLADVVAPDEVCRRVTAAAAQAVGAARCLLAEFGRDKGEVRGLAPAYGLPDETAAAIRYPVDDQTIALWDISDKPHLIVGEVSTLPAPLSGLAGRAGVRSLLAVRMIADGQPTGILFAADKEAGRFDEDDARLLAAYAQQAVLALERARQHAHAVERLERISALHDIDVAIASPLSLQATLDVLLDKVTERLRVDCAAIALIQPETRQLIYAARCCVDDEFFQDGLLRVQEGVVGQVAHTGQVAAIPDVRAEPRFVRAAIAERLGLVSYLAVPLQARGEILGVLELATRQPHDFPPEEVDFFVTLAGQAAIVIDNTRMYEQAVRRAAQQRALAESAGSILATLDAEAIWAAVTDAARQALAADRAAVYLYDAGADRLTCPYASGLSAEYIADLNRRFREVPGGRLLADPRPVVIADAQTDPATAPLRDMMIREDFRSYAVFPLLAPDGPLGALVAYRDRVAPFTPDDVTAGQTLAHIVAVAQQNARLFATTHEQGQRLETIGEVVRQSASLDLDEMLHRVVDLVQQTFGYYYVNVLLVDSRASELVLCASATPTGGRPYEGYRLKIGQQGITGWVAASGAPLLVNDVSREPRYHFADELADTQSELAAPILSAGQVIGVLDVQSTERDAFDAADLTALQTLAGHLAVAIENARRYEETRQRAAELAVLAGASQAIQRGGDLAEVLDAVLWQACGLVDTPTGSVLLLDEAQERLYVAAQRGLDPKAVAEWNRGIPRTFGTLGIVLATREILEVPDARHDPRVASGYGPVPEALTNVPLLAEGRAIGVLIIEGVPRDDSGRWVLRTLAEMAGVAIERARLFEVTRRRVGELEALAHIASGLRTARNADEMHPIILETALRVMGAQAGTFFLLDAEAQELYVAAAAGHREAVSHLRLRIGQGLAGRCWQTGAPILTDDISQDPRLVMPEVFQDLHKALCFPLRTVEGIIGVLLICFTAPGQPTAAEASLMATIGEMTGNALHRATLHEQTRRDAADLARAYDTTLEGWARALELRDQETEGHTRRVTEMALRLARAMGTFGEAELVHLRRGALLHDIGKMGIPDSILFKPGALSDEEWAVMRDHPVFAYELLSPIPYLHPALDIPYCHHEKWDGTGYPRGLAGEAIPLAARVFAVVDVWDALRSDRPYREGWPEETVREHIREQAGKHFDPRVVKVFLERGE